jgi:opacity protein-like surface antigen
MREALNENKALIAIVLLIGIAGAVFAATQTDIANSVTGTSVDQRGDAMQAQGDAMKAEDDPMESSGDGTDSEDSMNDSMEQ